LPLIMAARDNSLRNQHLGVVWRGGNGTLKTNVGRDCGV
jgi:hypothetical protein